MTQLYKISESILELLAIDADGDESLSEAIKNALDDVKVEFYEKVDDIVKLISQNELYCKSASEEIKRLTDRKKSLANTNAGLKKYILEQMELIDKKSIQTALFTITSSLGREAVIVDDESKIPLEFIKIKLIESPDKKELFTAIKNGNAVNGCHIERSGNSLRIK